MITTMTLSPGVTLRCVRDPRFKHSVLSLQFLRPMAPSEAAMNALLPDLLLRGTRRHPTPRAVTNALDSLYGASVGGTVRRVGDHQAVGFFCRFLDDRFALDGAPVFAPLAALLRELLLEPVTENGVFPQATVERQKDARVADIENMYNDKPTYAAARLQERMCAGDSFGVPRLGRAEEVAAITPQALHRQYLTLLRHAPAELFYVGSLEAEAVAARLAPIFGELEREVCPLPPHTPFRDAGPVCLTEESSTAQSCLNLGFVTPITQSHPDFSALRMLNAVYGAGMTSKLFMNVRERLSLCYSVGSDFYGTKGLLTVAAGIDAATAGQARREILAQLEACQKGEITPGELEAAREALRSGLRSIHDSPETVEHFYLLQALTGGELSLAAHRAAIDAVTAEDVARAANTLRLHSEFFLKGEDGHD